MPSVEVFYMSKNKIVSKEDKKDLFWYDDKKHKMHIFSASRLDLEYKYDEELKEYRMFPKPISEPIRKKVSSIDKTSVDSWFEAYSNYNDIEATETSRDENSVVFSVDEDELEDFAYSLERSGFGFSIRD